MTHETRKACPPDRYMPSETQQKAPKAQEEMRDRSMCEHFYAEAVHFYDRALETMQYHSAACYL